jgi:hypothetical protein
MDEMITLRHSCTDLRDADVSGANLRDACLIEAKHRQDQHAVAVQIDCFRMQIERTRSTIASFVDLTRV